ncbi:acylphosphatase [Thermomonas sp. HDW16]|uniref:acylphosphatase n=1 Tax=Thermomonas sp. HDW16 TaxID=2714945 RepID=UPI00197D8109|nr:acylphosphatase [Thermomonas sp. HDW16]
MTSYAARFLVRGKVQGVWFRAGTRDEALALGLRGYAGNLSNGDVEVLAVGDATAIERLAEWLRHGPPLARVESLQRFDADAVDAAALGFDIL